ncbi:MAG: biotin--[acetyl-CoA-carboxylase] ligase [Bacteroidetes bacterium]|nr:biotin--[acetyl-CoA-carboxylase] ligase [Bacteroidota bacterium]
MILEQLKFFESIHSTNVTLMNEHSFYLEHWDKRFDFYGIYTDEQTQGKGLGSNTWYSHKGQNILISFLFQPPITIQNQFYFNQYFSLAIYTFLSRYVDNLTIKWPNDIYAGNKKIAGILIEHSIQGSNLQCTIAGVGININQTRFDPTILNPTSLAQITGKEFDVTMLISELMRILEKQYQLIKEQKFEVLEQNYLSHLYQYQKWAQYRIKDQLITGRIMGLSSYGQLLIECESGAIYTCNYKEVKFLILTE